MGLKNYPVTINGLQTTLRLSDADAKAQGLDQPAEKPQKDAPPAKKTAAKKATPAKKAAPKPANKARTAKDK